MNKSEKFCFCFERCLIETQQASSVISSKRSRSFVIPTWMEENKREQALLERALKSDLRKNFAAGVQHVLENLKCLKNLDIASIAI
jgi:hypothetical protein